MKSKKFLSAGAVLLMLFGANSAFITHDDTPATRPGVLKSQQKSETEQKLVELDPEFCTVSIERSTKTDLGQSFQTKFTTSKTTYTVPSGLSFLIDDPTYSDNKEEAKTASAKFIIDPDMKGVELEFGLFKSFDTIDDIKPIADTSSLDINQYLSIKVKKDSLFLTDEDVTLTSDSGELKFNDEHQFFYIHITNVASYNIKVGPHESVSEDDKNKASVVFNIDPQFGDLDFEFATFKDLNSFDEQTSVKSLASIETKQYVAIKIIDKASGQPLTDKNTFLLKDGGSASFDTAYNAETSQFYFKVTTPMRTRKYIVKLVPVFEGIVESIPDVRLDTSEKTLHIPTTVTYGRELGISIYGMKANAIDFADNKIGNKIDTIVIPSTITSMPENAIINVPDGVQILVQGESVPTTWDAGWTDATNIKFASDEVEVKVNGKVVKTTVSEYFAKHIPAALVNQKSDGKSGSAGAKSFYIGTQERPLIMEYEVTKNDGTKETRTDELEISSMDGKYDSVGKDLGRHTILKDIDIDLVKGESIDPKTIVLKNIYETKGDTLELDSSKQYYVTPKFTGKVLEIDQFVSFDFDRISTFKGFSALEMTAHVNPGKDGSTIYSELMHFMYEKNKSKIEEGALQIRFRVGDLIRTNIVIKYEVDGKIRTSRTNLVSVKPFFDLYVDKPTNVVLLIDDSRIVDPNYSIGKIRQVFIEGLTLETDILNKTTGKSVIKSNYRCRFGNINLYDSLESKSAITNINVSMILLVTIFTLVYFIISASYFFYKKHAFKNDEFRRLNPKSFIKNATMGYLCLQITLLSIFTIVVRSTIMANSTAVYNPLDAFIIVFSVLALLLIGYFIRFYVILAKANIEKRKVDKLKLNDDIDDDGTK